MSDTVSRLIERGVVILDPASVYIAPEVDPERIHPGVVLYPGCRILGARTSIGPESILGEESPVTVRDCCIGARVHIAGGFLDRCTLLDGAHTGDGLHARPGCILEEQAGVAHTVGIKQTILFPFVELGSLINFCDILMAGGTSAKNHSEVGSSYIHFNFTPHHDKATASLVGDVPKGVLLNQNPIFLGGQGGLVGPRRIAFGTTVAAGSMIRHDITKPNLLVRELRGNPLAVEYDSSLHGRVDQIAENCFAYLDNLLALRTWYLCVRAPVLSRTPWGKACLEGLLVCLEIDWEERISRLDQLAQKLRDDTPKASLRLSASICATQREFCAQWPEHRAAFLRRHQANATVPEAAKCAVDAILSGAGDDGTGYLQAVQSLNDAQRAAVTFWLSQV